MGIGNIGWTEFVVILAIALIFFGPRRLPGIAQTLGKSLREFQKALNEVKSDIAQAGRDSDARPPLRSMLPKPSDLLDPSKPTPGASPPQKTGEGVETATPAQTRAATELSDAPSANAAPLEPSDRSATPAPPEDDDGDDQSSNGSERGAR
ncbi:MAG: twin-arginine translocase TatA/TatE family subunit [Gemmatimonadota bacterium]|nr:MAG: twin-arginine translocase TatA/TatE family subunit [Gemmatimonadota bacterium]